MAGTRTKPEPCLGLKPSQNPQYLVSGPSEAQVLDVSSQKELSERESDKSQVASSQDDGEVWLDSLSDCLPPKPKLNKSPVSKTPFEALSCRNSASGWLP